VRADEYKVTPGAEGGRVRGAARAAWVAAPMIPFAGGEEGKRGGRERPAGAARAAGPAGPVPGRGPQPGSPGQQPTYKLTVRVIAELYPPLTNERRWAFQNAIALSRGCRLIRAAARWDKLDEATVTIECQARDAEAAGEAARAIIRRTAALAGQIGVRDIKVVRVAPAG
jgi:hypothetical protein